MRMRLWLLTPRADVLARSAHPWRPRTRRRTRLSSAPPHADQARHFAHDVSGNEGRGVYRLIGLAEDEVAVSVWLRPEYTDCMPLTYAGEPGVVLRDHWEG
jgi:hypothetical protein